MISEILLGILKLTALFSVFGILVSYIYFKKNYNYWRERNVPHSKTKFPLGSLYNIGKQASANFFRNLYEESKHEKVYGLWFLHRPTLMVNDLDLLKKIFIENFNEFRGHGTYFDAKNDPKTVNLFHLEGSAWKDLKTRLSPIFTPAKLKKTLPIITKCGKVLQEILQQEAKMNETIDFTDLIKRFITDVVVSLAVGMEINYLKNPNSDMGLIVDNYLKPGWKLKLNLFVITYLPEIGKKLKMNLLSKTVHDYFKKILFKLIEVRKTNKIKRQDILQFLIDILLTDTEKSTDSKEGSNNEFKYTVEHLTSQVCTLVIGGQETVSNAVIFSLYELAANQDMQHKAREEIKRILDKHDGELTYEALFEMEYLGRITDETLRKYPPAPTTTRACASEFKDPDSNVMIDQGIVVMVPIFGIHRDDRYYPNPEKFDPERFTEEKKALRPNYAYIPFGDGNRNCIGQRLAIMLIMSTLVIILSKFKLESSERYFHVPLELDPETIVLTPKGKMMLKITPIN